LVYIDDSIQQEEPQYVLLSGRDRGKYWTFLINFVSVR